MAGLILCRSKYAKRPFYISSLAINIYSLEELCYYIYNNIYLVGTDLFSDTLVRFIGRELHETELASQLDFLIGQNAGLTELITTVFRAVDYYTENEILKFSKLIDDLDSQNVSARLKARADNFLANRRYNSAIRNYVAIVSSKQDSKLEPAFYGDTWHNMGVAYANMHQFTEAAECFQKAYELNQNEASRRSAFAAECMASDCMKNDSEDELCYVTFKEIETLMNHAADEPECAAVNMLAKYKEEGDFTSFNREAQALLTGWKKEYRNFVK